MRLKMVPKKYQKYAEILFNAIYKYYSLSEIKALTWKIFAIEFIACLKKFALFNTTPKNNSSINITIHMVLNIFRCKISIPTNSLFIVKYYSQQQSLLLIFVQIIIQIRGTWLFSHPV